MPVRTLIFALSAVIISTAACEPEPTVLAYTVCIACEHHGVASPEMTVYHKGGGQTFPGFRQNMLSVYDSLLESGQRNRVCFDQLGPGMHHFAAEGYDPLIRDSIIGELTIELTTRDPQLEHVMPVSERH